MAELEFGRHVPEIPQGERLPEPYKRSVTAEVTPFPDILSATMEHSASSNWMSAIGSAVAARASNALAEKIGNDLGKHPQGDLGIPLTEFDRKMQQNYITQAQSTLSLQADKLVTSSNIEAAKSPRITPDIIKKSQQNISLGLDKIFSVAPTEIKPKLEKIYGSVQLNQVQHLTSRMLREQAEDRKNQTILSNNRNAEIAHELASSGKFEEAELLVKSNKSINDAAIASNIGFTPQQGKVGNDTVRQSAISGRLQFEYEKALAEGKGEQFIKSLSKKPEWISDADYAGAVEQLKSFVNNKKSLNSDFEQLTMTDFRTRIAIDPGSISGSELQSTLDKLSPLNAAKLNLDYANSYKRYKKENADEFNLSLNWNNPLAHANSSPKVRNKTFNGKVNYVMNSKPGISRDEAEIQVASSAGAEIPVFTDTLKNKIRSGDPQYMVSAAKQINELQSSGNGHALSGLNEMDLALASDITHNYNPADPASAARIITENKQNQDATFRKESESTFANMIWTNTRKNGKETDDYILETFGMQGGMFHSGFDSPWSRSFYASDILSNYRTNFINTGRDNDRAISLTKDYIANNYGKTEINGKPEWTLHPLERACGFQEGEGIHIINADIMRQLSPPLEKLLQKFHDKKSPEYWTMEPVIEQPEKQGTALFNRINNENKPKIKRINLVKHNLVGHSMNVEKYPLRMVGNNFNWELNIETANGPRNVFLEAPFIGIHSYIPDLQWIKDHPDG